MLTTTYPALRGSVFVVTYGRSGSTLVQNLLNHLPGYLVRGENGNLLAPLARAWDLIRQSEQGAKMRSESRETLPQDPWYGFEGVSEEAFGRALARSLTETVLRPQDNIRVIGYKEIRWHTDPLLFPLLMEFLIRFFPNARFIFNTRDHAEVVRSGWWKQMDETIVRQELAAAETLYTDFATAHPDRCIALHYNRYITGPEAWRPLFDFLSEPFDTALVARVLDKKLNHMKRKDAGSYTRPE